ncbi:MAG TPA: hypothetical protein VNK95_22850, partial [Caldilineaceae bacterium]|nr:hypothetical protein [Caldilineaceae bacterium]
MRTRRTLACALLLGCGLVLLSMLAAPYPAQAQGNGLSPELCYAVADGYIDEQGMEVNGKDTLAYLNRQTGDTQPINGLIPNINTNFIEAITFLPGGQQLYAADDYRLGALALDSATFTAIGDFGTAQGQLDADPELESLDLNDIDGLSISPITGEMWGAHHTSPLNVGDPSPPDILVRINRNTGAFIPGAFADPVNPGQQVDFVVIQPIEGLNDIGDLAIDPLDGTIYAIMSEGGTHTRLVTINPA